MSESSIFDSSSPLFRKTPTYKTQEEAFNSMLPDNLYLSHYDLAIQFNAWTAQEWRRFLKEKERFIMTEVAAMTEAGARQALARLSTGKTSTNEVSAIRQLLERSEQINSQDKDQRTFVMLQFDTGAPAPPEDKITREQLGKLMLENDNNVRKLYGFSEMSQKAREHFENSTYIVRNHDNTLHFTDPELMSDLDHAYVRLFNPENVRVDKLPEIYEPEGYDVQ